MTIKEYVAFRKQELKDLIELNRKINKKLNDNLRMQCRLRNCYKRWAILNTLLYSNFFCHAFSSDILLYKRTK